MTKRTDERPVRPITEDEFIGVLATRPRGADKLLLWVLRWHDHATDGSSRARPGYRRMAQLAGISEHHVQQRLYEMRKEGVISKLGRGPGRQFVTYFINPPNGGKVRPAPTARKSKMPVSVPADDDNMPLVDTNGRETAAGARFAAELFGGKGAGAK